MQQHTQDTASAIKHGLDYAAGMTAFGTVLGLLPFIAAGLSVVWFLIRAGEWAERRYDLNIFGGRKDKKFNPAED